MDAIQTSQALQPAHVGALLLSVCVSLYLYIRSADRKALDDVKSQLPDIREKSTDVHTRLAILEAKVSHMPTHADLKGIQRELHDLNGEVSAIGERSVNTYAMVRSIQEHLMEGGR